jgi:hypothetical protein
MRRQDCIEEFLYTKGRYGVFNSSLQHLSCSLLEQVIEFEKTICKFALVRHPADRLVSEYFYQLRGGDQVASRHDLNGWIELVLNNYTKFNFLYDNHLAKQVDYFKEKIKLFRLEDGLKNVERYIGKFIRTNREPSNSFRINCSSGPEINQQLSGSAMKAGQSFYEDDFNFLNY